MAEFKTKLAGGNRFLNSVLRGEKVFLIGDEDELGKVGEYGWLKAEATSRDEIKCLLTIIGRDLRDANVTAISEDRRFEAAFSAAPTAATVAL